MIRHAECTRNKKQNRRNYKGFGRIKTRHYDIKRNEEERKCSRNTRALPTLLKWSSKREESKEKSIYFS